MTHLVEHWQASSCAVHSRMPHSRPPVAALQPPCSRRCSCDCRHRPCLCVIEMLWCTPWGPKAGWIHTRTPGKQLIPAGIKHAPAGRPVDRRCRARPRHPMLLSLGIQRPDAIGSRPALHAGVEGKPCKRLGSEPAGRAGCVSPWGWAPCQTACYLACNHFALSHRIALDLCAAKYRSMASALNSSSVPTGRPSCRTRRPAPQRVLAAAHSSSTSAPKPSWAGEQIGAGPAWAHPPLRRQLPPPDVHLAGSRPDYMHPPS